MLIKRYLCVVGILCLSLFIGCNKNNEVLTTDGDDSTELVLPTLDDAIPENNQYVVILLGYGYNEGDTKNNLLNRLESEYGLAKNGGKIIPFVYPDDFEAFGYERVSLLTDNIEDQLFELIGEVDLDRISAIITLGAPEGTHYSLAEMQDSDYTASVFSVFAQDDVLGTEAGSTLVIDYSIGQDDEENKFEQYGEIDLSYPGDVFDIISPLINASFDWEEVNKSGLFIPALRAEYKKTTEYNFFVFIDAQTGLRAENHYVLTLDKGE